MSFFKKHNLVKYLNGRGIEIGALNNPLKIDRNKAKVIYVDLFDRKNLIIQNPETPAGEISASDLIADAQDLNMIADGKLDFIIASHLFEHLPNPIKAMKEFHRVLKMGGVLYLIIPDKRYGFDKARPITPLGHLINDYKTGATIKTSIAHYQEWFDLVELQKELPIAKNLNELIDKKYRIHFHVWLPESILEMLNYMKKDLDVYFKLQDYYYRNGDIETVFVLKKCSSLACSGIPLRLEERYSPVRQGLCKIETIYRSIMRKR